MTAAVEGPRFPNVKVTLRNLDELVGHVRIAMRRAGVPSGQVDVFVEQVTSAPGRDNVLAVCMEWVTVT